MKQSAVLALATPCATAISREFTVFFESFILISNWLRVALPLFPVSVSFSNLASFRVRDRARGRRGSKQGSLNILRQKKLVHMTKASALKLARRHHISRARAAFSAS